MPFSEVASISQDPQDPVPTSHSGSWLEDLHDEAIDTIIRFGTPQNDPCPLTITEVRHVGGAMARVSSDENAFGQRDFPLVMDIVAMIPTPDVQEEVREHIRRFKADLGSQLPEVLLKWYDGVKNLPAYHKTAFPYSGRVVHLSIAYRLHQKLLLQYGSLFVSF